MPRVEESELDWDDDNRPYYRDEPFTGECVETAADGRLLSLSTYVDGLDEGPFHCWSGDGVLVIDGTCRRGRPVGTQREWYDSGAPKVERAYDERSTLVRMRRWAEDGTVTLELP
ncbi:hypothetical protein [Actinophytocola sp.]|jgi:antitoxin component YwqK of YwqJK toxin-antitoxin module|uniref:toxin-antitoxin system YwqK family antitoxin n=1 Tax=Actinophytocola sp. TaxID=1872138 RepID=UPI002EDB39F9